MKIKFTLVAILLLVCIPFPLLPNPSLNFLNRILRNRNLKTGRNIKRMAKSTHLLIDNPANYAIYQKLEGQIRGLGKMIGNSGDMLSYYRYEGAILKQALAPLQHIRQLILRRSGGILSGWQRKIINNEIRQYYKQIIFSRRTGQAPMLLRGSG